MEEIQKQIANIVSELMPQLCALSDEILITPSRAMEDVPHPQLR